MLKEDTKVELELSGEIDSKEESLSGGSQPSMLKGMSLPAPINISQPAVKECFGKRRANIRPFGVFFNTSNFQVSHRVTTYSLQSWQVFSLYSLHLCLLNGETAVAPGIS